MAVAVHSGDDGPLGVLCRFLLDERRQRHHLPHRQALSGGLGDETRRQRRAEAAHHLRQQRRGRRLPRHGIGVGEQVAFEVGRRRIEIADKRRVGRRFEEGLASTKTARRVDVSHLRNGETLAKRHRPRVDRAAREQLGHLHRTGRVGEAILARFQVAGATGHPQRHAKRPLVAHHPSRDQAHADRPRPRARWHIDELLVAQVAAERLERAAAHGPGRAAGPGGHKHQQREPAPEPLTHGAAGRDNPAA